MSWPDLSRCHPSLRLFDDMVVFECCRFPTHFGQPGERECGQSHDDIAYRNVIEVGGDQVRRYAEEPRTRDVRPEPCPAARIATPTANSMTPTIPMNVLIETGRT